MGAKPPSSARNTSAEPVVAPQLALDPFQKGWSRVLVLMQRAPICLDQPGRTPEPPQGACPGTAEPKCRQHAGPAFQREVLSLGVTAVAENPARREPSSPRDAARRDRPLWETGSLEGPSSARIRGASLGVGGRAGWKRERGAICGTEGGRADRAERAKRPGAGTSLRSLGC